MQWYTAEILAVAREAKWTPTALSSEQDKIGDYTKLLHEIRNLVHPGRYVREHLAQHVTKVYFENADKICQAARKPPRGDLRCLAEKAPKNPNIDYFCFVYRKTQWVENPKKPKSLLRKNPSQIGIRTPNWLSVSEWINPSASVPLALTLLTLLG